MQSIYYKHSSRIPFASDISLHQRRKMFDLFMNVMQPEGRHKVLDVGVSCDESNAESNYFEQLYPYPGNITCVGTEDGSHLEIKYAGLAFHHIERGQALPFRDAEFDIVFCNAVVEHVGGFSGQMSFIRETCRVAKHFFITTPCRWFPVEMHTGLPLLHFLPAPLFRKLIQGTRYDYWSHEDNLNLLSFPRFKNLFDFNKETRFGHVRLAGFMSNMIAYGHTPHESIHG